MARSLLEPDDVQRSVGRRVAELRADAGLTQEQLAERIKTGCKYVQSIEAGRENLSIQSLVKLANALQVPLDELFAEPKAKKPKRGRPPRRSSALPRSPAARRR